MLPFKLEYAVRGYALSCELERKNLQTQTVSGAGDCWGTATGPGRGVWWSAPHAGSVGSERPCGAGLCEWMPCTSLHDGRSGKQCSCSPERSQWRRSPCSHHSSGEVEKGDVIPSQAGFFLMLHYERKQFWGLVLEQSREPTSSRPVTNSPFCCCCFVQTLVWLVHTTDWILILFSGSLGNCSSKSNFQHSQSQDVMNNMR